jgi:hypothetical protein
MPGHRDFSLPALGLIMEEARWAATGQAAYPVV